MNSTEFVSEGCLDLTGYQPSDLIGNRKVSYAQLIYPNDRERVWQVVQTALRDNVLLPIVNPVILSRSTNYNSYTTTVTPHGKP